MLILASTSDKINLVTSSTADTDVQVSYADFNVGVVTLGRKNTALTSAATTDITGSPGASVQRNIKHVSVRNKHASTSQTITVQHVDGVTTVEMFSCVLAAGQQMIYDGEGGFHVLNSAASQTTNYSVPQTRILGRITASTGPVEFLTASQARTVLGLATTDSPTFNGLALTTSLTVYAGGGTIGNLGLGSDWVGFTADPALSATKYAFRSSPTQGTAFCCAAVGGSTMDFRLGDASVDPFMRLTPNGGLYYGPVSGISDPGLNNFRIKGRLIGDSISLGGAGDPAIGNIGLGAVPSTALISSYAGLIIGNGCFVAQNTIALGNAVAIIQNAVLASGPSFKYVVAAGASYYATSEGDHSFYTAPVGTAGATATFTAKFSINALRTSSLVPINLKSYTVATLPTGAQGDVAYVTDALTPGFLVAVVGGGTVKTPVFYNGTNWVAF